MTVAPRIGIGYDLHRLAPGQGLLLGGVRVRAVVRAVAHSDGDALLHAVTDAILGALGEPDIGELFPDNAPENRGRDSSDFLRHALGLMRKAGCSLGNIDIIIELQQPKIQPYKPQIRKNLASLCACDLDRINVKAKTGEGVGPIGTGQAIAVRAAAIVLNDE